MKNTVNIPVFDKSTSDQFHKEIYPNGSANVLSGLNNYLSMFKNIHPTYNDSRDILQGHNVCINKVQNVGVQLGDYDKNVTNSPYGSASSPLNQFGNIFQNNCMANDETSERIFSCENPNSNSKRLDSEIKNCQINNVNNIF